MLTTTINNLPADMFTTGNLLATTLNNFPEDIVTKANLFLADPTRFLKLMMPSNSRNATAPGERRKRSTNGLDWDVDYVLESLDTSIRIKFADKTKPLQVIQNSPLYFNLKIVS